MNRAYLLTGSNLHHPRMQVALAAQRIEKYCGKIIASSSLYGSSAWGITNQPDFINQALCIETNFFAKKLLQEILAIEKEMGRIRLYKMGPRMIDIDILLFNDDVINEPGLTVPHPLLPQRRFALEPLAEIAPAIEHPVLKKDIQTILMECVDSLNVYKI